MKYTWMMLIVVLIGLYPVRAQETFTCVDAFPPRMIVGERGVVTSLSANNVRDTYGTDGSQVIGSIPANGAFAVTGGPQCADGFVWWQIEYGNLQGWTAEAGDEYWLIPYIGDYQLLDADNIDQLSIVQTLSCDSDVGFHSADVIDISPDSTQVAIGCQAVDPSLRVYDARTWDVLATVSIGSLAHAIKFLPDDRLLVQKQEELVIYETSTYTIIDRLTVRPLIWSNTSLNPERTRIITPVINTDRYEVRHLNNFNQVLHTVTIADGRETAWSPDGNEIAIGTSDTIAIWNLDDDSIRRSAPLSWHTRLNAIEYAPDGETILTGHCNFAQMGCQEGRLDWFSAASLANQQHIVHEAGAGMYELAFTPDGRLLLALHLAGASIYSVETGDVLTANFSDNVANYDMALAPAGHFVIVARQDDYAVYAISD
jgi:WD40 repeat protein